MGNEDIAELKEENGYLVGNLYHLSNYALVAKQEDNLASETETAKINNPKTGDNIMLYVAMFVISTVGMSVAIKRKK